MVSNTGLLDACDKSAKLADLLLVISQVLHDESVDNQGAISCVGIAWDLNNDINNKLSLLSSTKAAPAEDIDLPHGSTIGERIHKLRKARGMIQPQIADAVNVSTQAVSLWENGSATPGSDKIIPLANALKCDPMWLLAGSPTDIAEES